MVFGTFDILHLGHISLFRQARKYGDSLIAVIARDHRVKKIKGSNSFHTDLERKKMLEHIDLIDKVVLGNNKNVYIVIKKIKPDVVALGYDQKYFVGALESKIKEFKLTTEVVRLKKYAGEKHKTGKIKKYLAKQI